MHHFDAIHALREKSRKHLFDVLRQIGREGREENPV